MDKEPAFDKQPLLQPFDFLFLVLSYRKWLKIGNQQEQKAKNEI